MINEKHQATRPNQAKATIHLLRPQLLEHQYRYHALARPTISNAAYDAMLHKLEALETAFPQFNSPSSPTQKIGAEPLPFFSKVEHKTSMLSLANAFDLQDLHHFENSLLNMEHFATFDADEKFEYCVELKIDGVAISLIYEKGTLVQAATRGNGNIGENVIANAHTIGDIPLHIPLPVLKEIAQDRDHTLERIEIRGEVFMTHTGFAQLNRQMKEYGKKLFSTPRNAAAGSLRQLDSRVTGRRPLQFAPHGLGYCGDGQIFRSQSMFLDNLSRLGFSTTTYVRHKPVQGIEEAYTESQAMLEARNTYPYEVDGTVIKINDYHQQKLAGCRTKSPRWGVAYKFPADEKETTVEDICFQVGRSGIVTPIAKLAKVWLGGVQVQSATLHNIAEMKKKGIHIGSQVTVKRAGDVIPYIVGIQKHQAPEETTAVKIPVQCPACSALLVYDKGNVRLRCPMRISCKAQKMASLVHFASRDAMGICGLGPSTAKRLLNHLETFFDIGDLYSIREEELLGLERFEKISAQKLLGQIEQSKQAGLGCLLYALGIDGIGVSLAKTIADKYRSMDNLIGASITSLEETNFVGPIIAHNIREFLHNNSTNRRVLEKLKRAGVSFKTARREERPATLSPSLEGKTFALSGTLSKPRHAIKAQLEERGAKVVSTISPTTILVCGENPGSKLAKAKSCGADILNEEGLRTMLW